MGNVIRSGQDGTCNTPGWEGWAGHPRHTHEAGTMPRARQGVGRQGGWGHGPQGQHAGHLVAANEGPHQAPYHVHVGPPSALPRICTPAYC